MMALRAGSALAGVLLAGVAVVLGPGPVAYALPQTTGFASVTQPSTRESEQRRATAFDDVDPSSRSAADVRWRTSAPLNVLPSSLGGGSGTALLSLTSDDVAIPRATYLAAVYIGGKLVAQAILPAPTGYLLAVVRASAEVGAYEAVVYRTWNRARVTGDIVANLADKTAVVVIIERHKTVSEVTLPPGTSALIRLQH